MRTEQRRYTNSEFWCLVGSQAEHKLFFAIGHCTASLLKSAGTIPEDVQGGLHEAPMDSGSLRWPLCVVDLKLIKSVLNRICSALVQLGRSSKTRLLSVSSLISFETARPNFPLLGYGKRHICILRKNNFISKFSFKVIRTKYKRHSDTCTQMFRAILFTMAKGGNNSNVHQHIVDKQNLVFTHKEREFNPKKEGSTETCANMDEPRKHHAK